MDMEFEVKTSEATAAAAGLRAQGFRAGVPPRRLGDSSGRVSVLDVEPDQADDVRSALQVLTTGLTEVVP